MNNVFNNLLLENVIKTILDFDNNYFLTRNKKIYIFKGYANKTIYFNNFKIRLRIRYYRDVIKQVNYYPVYEKFAIEKRFSVAKETRLEIARKILIDKVSYDKAKRINNNFSVSKATVFNYVNEFKNYFNYETKAIQNLEHFDKIFICIDDTFRTLKDNKKLVKYRFRVINFYQNKIANKFINQIKLCLSFETNKDTNLQHFDTLKAINNVLIKHYKYAQFKQNLYVCGDGAKYINKLANSLNATLILDKFHCFQNIIKVFNYRQLNRNLSNQDAIKNNEIKKQIYHQIVHLIIKNDFKKIYEILQKSFYLWTEKQKIIDLKRLINYFKNNEKCIENWNIFQYNPTLTETYIQQIIKSNFGSYGKIFSFKMFQNIIRINAYFYAF